MYTKYDWSLYHHENKARHVGVGHAGCVDSAVWLSGDAWHWPGNCVARELVVRHSLPSLHPRAQFFGHYGTDPKSGWSFAGLFTPLGGVTHETSAASYGVGPNHQDLAIHQDAIILNYFSEWRADAQPGCVAAAAQSPRRLGAPPAHLRAPDTSSQAPITTVYRVTS